jgi:hypothetical protein
VRDSGIDVLPDETNDAENGDRGKEKKQRLPTYVREHPEELRPVDRKSGNHCVEVKLEKTSGEVATPERIRAEHRSDAGHAALISGANNLGGFPHNVPHRFFRDPLSPQSRSIRVRKEGLMTCKWCG